MPAFVAGIVVLTTSLQAKRSNLFSPAHALAERDWCGPRNDGWSHLVDEPVSTA